MGAGWLGFNDAQKYDHWEWTSGTGGTWDGNQTGGSGTSYTNWNSGEPDDAGAGEDYAVMRPSDGLWNDAGPTSRYYAVMEFIPEPASMVLLGLGRAALALLLAAGLLGLGRRRRA